MGMYPSGTAALTSEGKVSTPDAIQVAGPTRTPTASPILTAAHTKVRAYAHIRKASVFKAVSGWRQG